MIRRLCFVLLALIGGTTIFSIPVDTRAAEFGLGVTYQGELQDSGVPLDGTADFLFKLFTAAGGGTQVGPNIALGGVAIADGLFTVELDFTSGGTIPGVYDGTDRWLEITVNGTLLSPRQRFSPTPHAIMARLLYLPFAEQTTAPQAFHLLSTASQPQTRTMLVQSASVDTGAVAITGEMVTGTTGNGTGVLGISRAGNGFGVIGTNLSPLGNCTGVYGNAESVAGIGVLGVTNHPTGATRGVYGKVVSPNGHAGYFEGRGYFRDPVGIGIESPAAMLHVVGGSASGLAFNVNDNLTVSAPNGFVGINRSTPISGSEFFGIRAPVTGTSYGGMYVETTSANAKPFYGYSTSGSADAWTYYDGTADQWRLYVGGDRITVDRVSGNVGIKRAPLTNSLEVSGTASKDVAGSWLANSDARIKTDVETVHDALDRLDQVRLVSFRYADDYLAGHPGIEDRTYLNVIAQEFRDVFPDHVKGSGEFLANGEEILQVDTYPLTIYAAAAIQELNARVRVQADELATQAAAIDVLTDRLSRLETTLASLASDVPVQRAALTSRGN